MNSKNKGDEEINMSLKEYYQMLMEGKRPMRSRQAAKPTSSSLGLGPTKSSEGPRKLSKEEKKGANLSLGPSKSHPIKSESEAKLMGRTLESPIKKTLRSNISPQKQMIEATRKYKKREEKQHIKEKLKAKKSDDKLVGKKPSSSLILNEVKALRQASQKEGRPEKLQEGVLKLRGKTLGRPVSSQQISEKKPKKSKVEEEDKKDSGLDDEDINDKKDDRKVPEKFEPIEPHSGYCQGRYVILPKKKYLGAQVSECSPDGNLIKLAFKEEIKDDPKVEYNLNEINFISKVFLVKTSFIQGEWSEHLNKFYKKDALSSNDTSVLLVSYFNDKSQQAFGIIIVDQKDSFRVVPVKLKESTNLNKDLKEFDKESAASILKPAFTSSELLNINLDLAQQINQTYLNYFEKVKQVPLTQENMEDLLFSIINFEVGEPGLPDVKPIHKQKQAIFLRYKYDPYYKSYLIFMRMLSTKNSIKERTEWLDLSKHRIKADLNKGYVSMEYLLSLENVNNSLHKLKLKSFTLVGHKEIQLQKNQTLRPLIQFNDNNEQPRRSCISKEVNSERCTQCNYIASEIEHLKCVHCLKVYHEQCLKKDSQACLGLRENQWRCKDCLRCVNCVSCKNRNQLLICQKCNTASHYDCLDQSVKLSIPAFFSTESKDQGAQSATKRQIIEQNYLCEQCIKCQHCGAKEAGDKRLNKWSKDFKLCSNCNKKRKNKQYCLICEKFWPENLAEVQQPFNISCSQCSMSVHLECDRMFENPELRDKFLSPESTLHYNCQQCRQQMRASLISQLIDQICQEDKNFYFHEPVEDLVMNYTKVIKNPMCFKYIKTKIASEYLRNPDLLKADISLVFSNAMIFNLPKHKVHKEAIKMNEICQNLLQSVWTVLEKNKNKTLDEDTHQQKMKWQVLKERQRQNLDVNEEQKELDEQMQECQDMAYILKPDELFDQQEHQVVGGAGRQYGVQDDIELEGSVYAEKTGDKFQHGDIVSGRHFNEDDAESLNDGGDNSRADKLMTGAISKNLRVRKQINYNEDRLLASGGIQPNPLAEHLNLSGSKRTFKQTSSFLQDSGESLLGGRGAKRPRFPDIQNKPQLLSGANLLQQAIHQEAKLQEQMEQQKQDTQKEGDQQNQHIQQQQQMMMNYYQEIDDEKCYYSNPARCSFDDPTLLFEEMCYLCGSFGNREDFLSCTLCGESFHTYCLQLPDDSIQKFQSYWKCLNCKFCEICSSATQEAYLLYCDVCDKAFHSFCLKPKLQSIPNCQWKCQECFSCQKCGTKNFFSEEEAEQKKNLEVVDFEFSQNFQYCYNCGLNEYKMSFCKICQKKSEDQADQEKPSKKKASITQHQFGKLEKKESKQKSPSDKMLKCSQCGFYSHLRCSRLLPDQDCFDNPDSYKCLECLLAGKTINHLIRETCEHYENIHQIISRHKLLFQLCHEILIKYFPIQEKAPLFIKSFIDQNQDFFKNDELVNEWLALLETNVCFEQPEDDANNPEIKKEQDEDEMDDEDEEVKAEREKEVKRKKQEDQEQKFQFRLEQIKNQKAEQSQQPDQKWDAQNFLQSIEKKSEPVQQTEEQKVYQQIFGHKEGFLPPKRNLYQSLQANNLHRFGQRQHFMDPKDLIPLITPPTFENLQRVNFAKMYVEIELKAIMKIKMTYFKWFEELIRNILKNNQKFIKKEKKRNEAIEAQLEEGAEESKGDIQQEQQVVSKRRRASQVGNQEDEIMTLEDTIVNNPQTKLQCILCRLHGEFTVTGRLIPFQVNQFVHVNCALWSTDVFEIGDGQLINFFYVFNGKAKTTKCSICSESGATIFCQTKKCHNAFHFPCAYRNNKIAFLRTKETFCDQCSKYKDFKVGYLEELTTKRRFQVAKNQVPYNMTINQIPQPALGSMTLSQQQQYLAQQQQQQQINAIQNSAELEKALQIEKWRPYYYDMFNRVGNLTVLSLKREINHLIEESINQSKKEINFDQLQDFAAVRIYWRFYLDQLLTVEDDQAKNPLNIKKTYYLYHNNQIREVLKNDLKTVNFYGSDRLRDKIQVAMHIQSQTLQKQDSLQVVLNKIYRLGQQSNAQVMPFMNQTNFWQKIMNHFQKERPNFSLQNIIFSISEFVGKTKYPISIWNRAEAKNKGFFIKCGSQGDAPDHFTVDDVFKRMLKINQMGDNQNPLSSMKRLTSSKHMQYDKMLNLLGKKMFYTKSHFDDNSQQSSKKTVLAKKIRLADTIDTNKEIDLPIAMKYRLSKTQPKRVEVGPSKIHRNGLFTLEDLMPGDIVIEYVGEKIRNKVADKREEYYVQKGIGDCYLFRLDKEYIVDATFYGNKSRYLNHSCDANCIAKVITVQQQKHIIICTNRQIKSGEELTYNYNFDYETNKIECFCGAPNCLGRLN